MDVQGPAAVVVGFLLVSSGAFLVPLSSGEVEPVGFDDTLRMGMTSVDVRAAEAAGYALPRAQVFYGQYQYVIGYYGVESLVSHLHSGAARRQFGDPLAVFVTDYSGTEPTLTNGGYLDLREDPGLSWTRAGDAVFVVGSSARTPAGATTVPFSDRREARAFAEAYGGTVVGWDELSTVLGDDEGTARSTFRAAVENRSDWADRQVERRRALLSRPVSVVVGEDAPTLSGAVERAPPNTTVLVPPGRYETSLAVEKPVTIRGAGPETVIDGGGNGTVVTVRSDRVALASLAVAGTGDVDSVSPSEGNASAFEDRTMLVYGRSDAGVLFDDANESLVADVRVDTSATGVLLRYSDRTVVTGVTIRGAETPDEGSMGVMPMYSRVVVEDSTVRGGRDGVYTHRADGTVIRNTDVADMRYGVHEMYTSELLVRNNSLRGTEVGVILMTRPSDNLVVSNRASRNRVGIVAIGDTSYVAGNVLVDNELGMNLATTRSLVTHNTVFGNDVGVRAGSIVPTNQVVRNDVVDNDSPVVARTGPVHVWTVAGDGNYWGAVPGIDRDGDGAVDRPYRPSSRLDLAAGGATGGPAVARSPALGLLTLLADSVPGLRDEGVLDTAPRTEPVRPAVLREVRNQTHD